MLGLVLEGGGAKGSYHAGAIKALGENGYKFDGVMGTSIGAVNGAIIAQGDTDKCIELWENIQPSKFIDVDDKKIENYFSKKYDRETLRYLFKMLRGAIANKGFSTEKTKLLLKSIIDEDKLRKSKTDFGLVTVSLTDRMPIEIFKEEIPYGMMHDYIMASAYFPAFRSDPINGKKYFDGGIYDNLPINPLIRRGYDEIVAIRTMSNMPHQSVIDDTVKVTYILPSDSVGGTISVYSSSIQKNMKMGYYDTLRVLKKHSGNKFYFCKLSKTDFDEFISNLSENCYKDLRAYYELDCESSKEEVLKRLFSCLRSTMKSPIDFSDYEVFILFLERFGLQYNFERFIIYDMESFLNKIKAQFIPEIGDRKRFIDYIKYKNSNLTNLLGILIKE